MDNQEITEQDRIEQGRVLALLQARKGEIRQTLVNQASEDGEITYGELYALYSVDRSKKPHRYAFNELLDELSSEAVNEGGPMLTAVVVSDGGMPLKGFFSKARLLGRFAPASSITEEEFWIQERDAVRQYNWQ